MARPSTTIIIFFVVFNLLSLMMMTQGVDEMLGVDAEVGEEELVEEKADAAENTSSGTGGDDLFGMYTTLAQGVETFYEVAFAGPIMLERAGVPSYITGFLKAVFAFVIAFDVISFMRGFSL